MTHSGRIGALRRKLILETPVDTPDESGGFSRAWSALASVWCEIESLRGDTTFAASSEETTLTHRIRLRWRPDVDNAARLRWGSRAFAVVSAIDADAARRYLICHCREYDA